MSATGVAYASTGTARTVCDVVASLTEPVVTDHIQVDIDYSSAFGTFVGEASYVDCEALSPGVILLAHDHCRAKDVECYAGAGRLLTLVLQAPQASLATGDLARCTFETTNVSRLSRSDFALGRSASFVDDFSGLAPVEHSPAVELTMKACRPAEP